MNFPKRAAQHIQESRSFKAFIARLPDEWVIRHVTERDYGLDCLVEIPMGENNMVGYIFGAQLKDTRKLGWRKNGSATLYKVASSTANYWMGLPFPVFLFLFVETEDKMFIANVRQQCRQRYSALLGNGPTHFIFHRDIHLDDPDAELLLVALFFREQSFESFSMSLHNLLVYIETHVDFIVSHWQCDSFLEVEADVLLGFVALYNSIRIVADYVNVACDAPSPDELFLQDRADFGHSQVLLHEQTLAGALHKLTPIYCDVLRAAKKRVTGDEFSFWLERDSLLANYCYNLDSEYLAKTLQGRLGVGTSGWLE